MNNGNLQWTLLILIVLTSCSKYEKDSDILETNEQDTFNYLHLSDPHGSLQSIKRAALLLSSGDDDFGIITGDVTPSQELIDNMNVCVKPFLMIPGNHDGYDNIGQYEFRRWQDRLSFSSTSSYGGERKNYWYRDFIKNDRVLRCIALDQYETDEGQWSEKWDVTWTQEQIDWFVNIMEKSVDVDGIVVFMHCGWGNRYAGQRDVNNENEFISIYAHNYNHAYLYTGNSDPLMIPDIVNAYQTGVNITNQLYPNDGDDKLMVTTHFTSPQNNFIAYFGGHLHWDVVEFLKDYPRQLQVLVAASYEGPASEYCDLTRADCKYAINRTTIDFNNRTLTIKRIGAARKKDGTIRDTIQFHF